jgi:thiol-disulfide isomerase/thioredoxin
MRIIILIIVFLSCFRAISQVYPVSGIIYGLSEEMIYLADFYGDQQQITDSVQTNVTGTFILPMEGYETGFYRIIFKNQRFIDFIYNQEPVSFTTNADNPFENIKFSTSVENLIWYDYVFRKEESQYKLELLNPLLIYYPENTDFYQKVRDEYNAVQDDFERYVLSVLELNSQTYAAKAIRIDKPIALNPNLPVEKQNDYLKESYFSGFQLDDPSMLRSNVISSKIIGYLSLYRDPAYSKDKQEEEFIRAIDTILLKTMDNEEIYNFTLQYLIDGFELYGFDRVITHIAEHYQPADACINDQDNSELVKRMENIRNLAVGKEAPDIDIVGHNGERFILSAMDSEYALIVFWATWCSHCQAVMPDLSGIHDKKDLYNMEIIAIAVDTSQKAYEKYLQENQFGWINYFSPLGWDSKPAKDYSIFATPTMFLLNRKREIIAKPAGIRELKKSLEDLP